MKNLNAFLLFVVMIAFFIACDSKTKKTVEEEPSTPKTTTDSLDLISRSQFNQWVKGWRDNDSAYIDTSRMTYFNVPIVDFEDMLGESADSVRAYIGLESLGSDNYAPHIMFVGMVNGSPNFDIIADYSHTCPPWCD